MTFQKIHTQACTYSRLQVWNCSLYKSQVPSFSLTTTGTLYVIVITKEYIEIGLPVTFQLKKSCVWLWFSLKTWKREPFFRLIISSKKFSTWVSRINNKQHIIIDGLNTKDLLWDKFSKMIWLRVHRIYLHEKNPRSPILEKIFT